jgi:hypothetical protein
MQFLDIWKQLVAEERREKREVYVRYCALNENVST